MNDRNIYLQIILLLEFWALARSFQGLGQLYQSLQLHSQSKNYHVLFSDFSKKFPELIFNDSPPTPVGQGPCGFDKGRSRLVE